LLDGVSEPSPVLAAVNVAGPIETSGDGEPSVTDTVPGTGGAWRTSVNQEEPAGRVEDHRDTEKKPLRACKHVLEMARHRRFELLG
jgi:hypothetical protein